MYQRNLPIYDGRYDANCPISTTAPPVQLFHPVFGHFLDDIADEKLDVPREILRAAASGKTSNANLVLLQMIVNNSNNDTYF